MRSFDKRIKQLEVKVQRQAKYVFFLEDGVYKSEWLSEQGMTKQDFEKWAEDIKRKEPNSEIMIFNIKWI